MTAAVRCIDVVSLANFLGFAPQNLFYLVALRDSLYREIQIPKRDDPTNYRKIHIPCSELKGIQRSILKEILSIAPVSAFAYAYVKGKSVCSAVKHFTGKQSVLKVDLKDFFPSIKAPRIFGLFRKLGFNDKAAFVLTNLCTYRGALTQGAPTSPTLSNLICVNLDDQLSALANSWGLKYLRYSDDLFFYGPKNYKHKVFLSYVTRVVSDSGFSINRQKLRYCPVGRPRFTLGLVSHRERLHLPRQTRRNYRAAFFKASRNLKWARENLDRLSGMAEWYKSVYGRDETYAEYRKIIRNVQVIRLHEQYLV